MCVCVCVCACVRACVGVCVCVYELHIPCFHLQKEELIEVGMAASPVSIYPCQFKHI
jgi:hypothetical protein